MEFLLAQEVGAQGLCAAVSLFATATSDRALAKLTDCLHELTQRPEQNQELLAHAWLNLN